MLPRAWQHLCSDLRGMIPTIAGLVVHMLHLWPCLEGLPVQNLTVVNSWTITTDLGCGHCMGLHESCGLCGGACHQ